jgi:hypothetical protein
MRRPEHGRHLLHREPLAQHQRLEHLPFRLPQTRPGSAVRPLPLQQQARVQHQPGLAVELESRRERRRHHLAPGAQVVLRHPVEQPPLRLRHHRPIVHYGFDGSDGKSLRRHIVTAPHHPRVQLPLPHLHHDPHARLHRRSDPFCAESQKVGNGQGDHHVHESPGCVHGGKFGPKKMENRA